MTSCNLQHHNLAWRLWWITNRGFFFFFCIFRLRRLIRSSLSHELFHLWNHTFVWTKPLLLTQLPGVKWMDWLYFFLWLWVFSSEQVEMAVFLLVCVNCFHNQIWFLCWGAVRHLQQWFPTWVVKTAQGVPRWILGRWWWFKGKERDSSDFYHYFLVKSGYFHLIGP